MWIFIIAWEHKIHAIHPTSSPHCYPWILPMHLYSYEQPGVHKFYRTNSNLINSLEYRRFMTTLVVNRMDVKLRSNVVLICLCLLPMLSFSQKQLVLLKGEKVKLRLYGGDQFVYKLKGDNTKYQSYVNNLSDTSVTVHRDVVPFYKIDRVYFKQSSFRNVIGGLLVVAGAGYFLIDQFNVIVVQGDDPNVDKNVGTASAVMVGVGLPLLLIKKKSQRLHKHYRLLTVQKGSPFYHERPASMNIIEN